MITHISRRHKLGAVRQCQRQFDFASNFILTFRHYDIIKSRLRTLACEIASKSLVLEDLRAELAFWNAAADISTWGIAENLSLDASLENGAGRLRSV